MPFPIEKKLVIAVACSAIIELLKSEREHDAGELVTTENLNSEEARPNIISSLKREYASDAGTELNSVLPKMSPLNRST
jgi:type I restriction enzyme R subunit